MKRKGGERRRKRVKKEEGKGGERSNGMKMKQEVLVQLPVAQLGRNWCP